MADLKISDLPPASVASGTMEFEVNDSGTSRRLLLSRIVAASGGFKSYDNFIVLSTSQTWTAPANIRGRVTVIGPGGSGALVKGNSSGKASGGGAGGFAQELFEASSGQSATVTVGAPGAMRDGYIQTTSLDGLDGGQSSFVGFGLNVIANGGKGGKFHGSSAAGALGGTASGAARAYQGGGSGTASGATGAATGGGAVAFFGTAYSSGVATSASSYRAASGGAGIGGKSADALANSFDYATGGGGAGGPSVDFNGGPSSGVAMSHPLALSPFGATYGKGGGAGAPTTPSGGGGGGGATFTANNNYKSGDGGVFGGGGAMVCTQEIASGGSAGIGAGSGGVVSSATQYSQSSSAAGGVSVVVIEWDVVS